LEELIFKTDYWGNNNWRKFLTLWKPFQSLDQQCQHWKGLRNARTLTI